MKLSLNHKIALLLCLIGSVTGSLAQNASRFTTKINNNTRSGFYKIMLDPEIIGKATKSLYDVRILNGEGKQVPYLLRTDAPVFKENNFVELKVLGISKGADKQTHIVIQNVPGKLLSELFLVVKNNDAFRSVTLSGSDDQKQWFVIKENISLSNISSPQSDRYVQTLEFPGSSYNYFKIIINGKDLLPINIIRAGIYENVLHSGKYVENPAPSISQKDSGRNTYVHVRFKEPYQSDEIELKISGAKFYQRKLHIVDNEDDYYLSSYDLTSGKEARFPVNLKSKEIKIVIENEDNPALEVKGVNSFQLSKYLLAFLDSAQEYKIVLGDSTLNAPRYDIGYFKDSLQNAVSVIGTGAVTAIPTQAQVMTKNNTNSTVVMWVIIGAVLALLLYLTMRMTKEVNTKNDNTL